MIIRKDIIPRRLGSLAGAMVGSPKVLKKEAPISRSFFLYLENPIALSNRVFICAILLFLQDIFRIPLNKIQPAPRRVDRILDKPSLVMF